MVFAKNCLFHIILSFFSINEPVVTFFCMKKACFTLIERTCCNVSNKKWINYISGIFFIPRFLSTFFLHFPLARGFCCASITFGTPFKQIEIAGLRWRQKKAWKWKRFFSQMTKNWHILIGNTLKCMFVNENVNI